MMMWKYCLMMIMMMISLMQALTPNFFVSQSSISCVYSRGSGYSDYQTHAGVMVLFKFFSAFLNLLSSIFGLEGLSEFSRQLPQNTYQAKKYIGHEGDCFKKYVSCPKCHYIYDMDICKCKMPDGTIQSRKCTFVKFPNHPMNAYRTKYCGGMLMKSVKTSSGTLALQPNQVFCYRSIIDALQALLEKPNFSKQCEVWRNRVVPYGTLSDVYDGRLWKEFLNPDGQPFLSLPYNFALALNIDWFQPFKRSVYSCGAMYITILNLPREERYMIENTILVGVIPGPREPKKTMNSYLTPLVRDLRFLWDGVELKTSLGTSVLVRAALLCLACDIPAARKVSGFMGHNAFHACSRCLKEFPTPKFGEKPDYSGFDRSQWQPRTNTIHRHHANKHRLCKTAQERADIERTHGLRYSLLADLPYYDMIRMCVVDPMHNLLLGTAHHVVSVWKQLGLLDLTEIQSRVDSFVTPSDVGRIPLKIASGFSQFTADQWRNWVLLYSLRSVKGMIPLQHYDCWLLFVKATYLLCRKSLTIQQVDQADQLLMEFCLTFERLYGKEHLNINLHLHGHLKECLLDFGPVYAFWLFGFERLNGILESYSTNSRDIPVQIMRRFLAGAECDVHNWPSEFISSFSPLLKPHTYSKGSLTSTSLEMALSSKVEICPIPPVYESTWETHQKMSLLPLISAITGLPQENFQILTLFNKIKAVSIGKFVLGSFNSRYKSSYMVIVSHPGCSNELHLARIEYIAKVGTVQPMTRTTSDFWVACVRFHFQHEYQAWFGGPNEVWSTALSPDCFFVPLDSIKCHVAFSKAEIDFGHDIQTVLVVSPLGHCQSL